MAACGRMNERAGLVRESERANQQSHGRKQKKMGIVKRKRKKNLESRHDTPMRVERAQVQSRRRG